MAFGVHLGHDDFMLLKFRALQAVGKLFVGTRLPFVYNFDLLVLSITCCIHFFVYILSYHICPKTAVSYPLMLSVCVHSENFTLRVRFCQWRSL